MATEQKAWAMSRLSAGMKCDKIAEVFGYKRDVLTFESTSGPFVSHGYIKEGQDGQEGIVIKVNYQTGHIQVIPTEF